MSDKKFWLGQLRHAYKNILDGAVKDHVSLANYLLSPAIKGAEEAVEELDKLREENAQLRLRIANLDADNIKERNALKEQVGDLKESLEKTEEMRKDAVRQWNAREKEWGETYLKQGERLAEARKIVAIAREHYKVIRGTMAAQSKTGLALKDALGEE